MEKGLSLRWQMVLAVVAALLFGLGLEAWHMLNYGTHYKYGPGISPVRSFRVHLGEKQFAHFERQILDFGATFGFKNETKPSSPRPYDVFFFLTRSDIDFLGTNDMEKNQIGLRFSVGFYPKVDGSAPPPPPENVNVLVEGLKKFLAPVEGAVMTEIASPKR